MTAIIQCRDLTKRFGGKLALNQVSFTLGASSDESRGDGFNSPRRGATALVGPNGAGKTTLFNILANYQQPSSGDITLLGHAPGASALLGRISSLPQDALLDPAFTIGQQLTFYAKLQGYTSSGAQLETDRVLQLVNLSEVLSLRPTSLSHGMKKRVAIAQALIGSPQLVLLDEPTAGLDPASARQIRALIADLSEQAHFIISSHNFSELEQLCDTVLLLEQGVMSQQKIGHANDNLVQHLSLQLVTPADNEVVALLNKLSGLISLNNQQKNRLVISYNGQEQPRFDRLLLDCLYQHGIDYRQLVKGQSLEQQLFD